MMSESSDSKDRRLIRQEIIFEVFQHAWSSYLNVTDGWTDNLLWHNCALRSISQ